MTREKKKQDREGSTFLQGNKLPVEDGKTGSSLAATSHDCTLEEPMLGGNSSISEALPKTSNRETLMSSKHGQSSGTASKVHSRVCQDKLTLQKKTSAHLEEFVPLLAPESPKSSSGRGRDPSPAAQPMQSGSKQQAPNRENQKEREVKKLDKMSAGLASNPICRRCKLREVMLVLLDP